MKKTFITKMPDISGAFLRACKIVAEEGCNIVRVSYNKAVDLYTLFIDAEGSEENLQNVSDKLNEIGYSFDGKVFAQVLLVEFMLENKVGAIEEILEILEELEINISYINSQVETFDNYYFKAGLYIDEPKQIKELLDRVAKICQVKILDYDTTETLLDSAIFYVSFAGDMRSILSLDQEETNAVIASSNEIMQHLDLMKELPHKTFEYIKKFAKFIQHYKGDNFFLDHKERQLTEEISLHIFTPPCGSNIYTLECGEKLLFVDSGFACFKREILKSIKEQFPNWDNLQRELLLTHSDIDHAGNLDLFNKIYLSQKTYEDFLADREGGVCYRSQSHIQAPYARLSRIISGYKSPSMENMVVLDTKKQDEKKPLSEIGEFEFCGLNFQVLLGNGGHVCGETVYICKEIGLIFTGDNYVNIRGFSKEQASFNRLAPYLMSSVNTDSKKATAIRKEIEKIAYDRGSTLLCPAHGDWLDVL